MAKRNRALKKTIMKTQGVRTIDSKLARQIDLAAKKEKRCIKMRALRAERKAGKMDTN